MATTGETRNVRQTVIIGAALSLAAAAASYLSWQIVIHLLGNGEFIDFKLSEFTLEKLVNVLDGLATWGSIPFLYIILFFLAAGLLTTFILKDQSWKESLIAAMGILAAFLIFLYGYVSHYGLMLSSIHRYSSVFTFACFGYLFLRIFSFINPKKQIAFRTGGSRKTVVEVGGNTPEAIAFHGGASGNTTAGTGGSTLESIAFHAETSSSTTAEVGDNSQLHGSILKTLLPKKGMRAGHVLILGVILAAIAVFILFSTRTLQLKNETWKDAENTISSAETIIQQDLRDSQKSSQELSGDSNRPARCYLALGGDIRKESQRHETYALEAIGTGVNIQNIWCDKLVNEAVDGVVTEPETRAAIWAENLREGRYEYVIVSRADAEIEDAIWRIMTQDPATEAASINPDNAAQIPGKQKSQADSIKEDIVLKIVPSEGIYEITLIPVHRSDK